MMNWLSRQFFDSDSVPATATPPDQDNLRDVMQKLVNVTGRPITLQHEDDEPLFLPCAGHLVNTFEVDYTLSTTDRAKVNVVNLLYPEGTVNLDGETYTWPDFPTRSGLLYIIDPDLFAPTGRDDFYYPVDPIYGDNHKIVAYRGLLHWYWLS
jgi:hypothetical protein